MLLSQQQRFPRSLRSVRAARLFTDHTLTAWGITERLSDIRLCVSELSTNAVLHGVPPGREFRVGFTGEGGVVRVEVRDSGGRIPELKDPDMEMCTGRGLLLVKELADAFGVTEHVVGKTVWIAFKSATEPGGEPVHASFERARPNATSDLRPELPALHARRAPGRIPDHS